MSSGYSSDQWNFFSEKFIYENSILICIPKIAQYKMITAAQKYEKTSAGSSNDGIEAYLSQKDVEKCDTKNTHPLLRLSYLLFRSSESYGTLQMLHGIRGVKTAVRCIFEEVSMHDMLKSGDSDGSLRFKAKSES